jgi:hypothetical protein
MKLAFNAMVGIAAGAVLLLAGLPADAAKRKSKKVATATSYELQGYGIGGATSSAVQSAVRSARDDASRRAKEKAQR